MSTLSDVRVEPKRKMGLEVSKKIREAIKAKLLELGSHIDEELPDYVMILIANRRTVPQMEMDLSLFLGESSKKFVSWLTHVLKKLDQVTSSGPIIKDTTKEKDETAGSSDQKKSKKGSKSKKEKGKKVGLKVKTKEGTKNKKKKLSKKKETVVSSTLTEASPINAVAAVISTGKAKPSTSTSEVVGAIIISGRQEVKMSSTSANHVDSTCGVPAKDPISKVRLTMKTLSPSKRPKVSSMLLDSAEDEPKPALSLLSDDDETPIIEKRKLVIRKSNKNAKEDDTIKADGKLANKSEKKIGKPVVKDKTVSTSVSNAEGTDIVAANPEDSFSQADTLILNTEENEFADNVDELRRVALESQEKKRRENSVKEVQSQQKKLNEKVVQIEPKKPSEKDVQSQPKKPSEKDIQNQQKKPIEKNVQSLQKILITSILMGNKDAQKEDSKSKLIRSRSRIEISSHSRSTKSLVRASSRESPQRSIKKETPTRILRSPKSKKSVFDRLSGSHRRRERSHTRSRSPIRKLTSTIGNIINRTTINEEYDPIRPSVNSVVKVTDRPKRDLKMNNKLLMLAVKDAQKSIIQKEQQSPMKNNEERRKNRTDEKVKSDKEIDVRQNSIDRVTERRFSEFPEVNSNEFYDSMDPNTRRKSVKERLGVKRIGNQRRPVKERLGVMPGQELENAVNSNENESAFNMYNDDEFNIVINVNDNKEKRNVTLASMPSELENRKLNRISIQLNNSDGDTSDEDYESSDEENKTSRAEKNQKVQSEANRESEADGDEVCVSITDEDKLPEVPDSDVEYIVEEIECEDGEDLDGFGSEHFELNQQRTKEFSKKTESSQESDITITLNSNMSSSSLEVQTVLAENSSKVFPQGSLQCKFWPNCQYNDKCMYEHPKCKFNPCKNTSCIYKHLSNKQNADDSSLVGKKKVCKFYPKCTSMSCKFYHPSPCRFGVGCTALNCQNYHPGVTIGMQKLRAKGKILIPKVNELKWVKKD